LTYDETIEGLSHTSKVSSMWFIKTFKYLTLLLVCSFSFANTAPTKTYRYYNARLLHNHELMQGELWTADGQIIVPRDHADIEVDLEGLIIAPGYIDLQVNGAFGVDFSYGADRVEEVAALLPQFGVTAFLPTLVSLSQKQYAISMPFLQPKEGGSHGASILGIHLEGPFFNPQQKGAHDDQLLTSLNGPIEDFYGSLEGVKIVTLAPELPGMGDAIRELKEKNIVVSAGHTLATYEDMQKAVDEGVGLCTHLFNAMTPFHHRSPGIIGAVLDDHNIHYTVIADGVHLHPSVLNLAWKSKPRGLVLVTDAIQALGLPSGSYKLGSMEVDVQKGRAYVQGTQTIAGSVLSMDQAVRNFRIATNCSIVDAIEAATLKPARVLGIQDRKGTLGVGSDADFIVLNDDLYVQASYVNGHLAWQKADRQ
jgi:N-acetylglucosamine-6-phosphate deacetylase